MSGVACRRKGNRVERAVVHALQDCGLAAERVPLSGAARGRFGGDVSVPLLGRDHRVEVKARSNGFRRLYGWLGEHDFLILKADPLVVLPLSLAAEIAAIAERASDRSREHRGEALSAAFLAEAPPQMHDAGAAPPHHRAQPAARRIEQEKGVL